MTEVAEQRRGSAKAPETAKRAADLMLALTAITILIPILMFLWLLVRSTSRGPALFRQERLGRDKRPFMVLKLRTMYVDNDDRIHRDYVTDLLSADGAVTASASGLFKLEADPRVTWLGGWLRRSSLDELPQLINVLRGEMSLVGPRPVFSWEAEMFGPQYGPRFDVKPGMTGLWQVSGRSRLSMRQALELDIEYVARRSFLLDLSILLRTIPALFGGGAR
jgi:lipopolysaccharide/colanic/teichoic acid biosynthesis glycosyltransferase